MSLTSVKPFPFQRLTSRRCLRGICTAPFWLDLFVLVFRANSLSAISLFFCEFCCRYFGNCLLCVTYKNSPYITKLNSNNYNNNNVFCFLFQTHTHARALTSVGGSARTNYLIILHNMSVLAIYCYVFDLYKFSTLARTPHSIEASSIQFHLL